MEKKLYRNMETNLVGGVLAGFSDYFEQDVTLWRLLFIIFLILTGLMPGVIIYLVAWVIIPEKPLIEPLDKVEHIVYD